LSVLNGQVLARYAFDLTAVQRNRDKLLAARGLAQRLQQVFGAEAREAAGDPELLLYSGFFDDHDRRLAEKVRHLRPEQLGAVAFTFHDARLPELLFRYRARNYPETLSAAEAQRWREHCRRRLSGELPGAGLDRAAFDAALIEHADKLGLELVSALRAYADEIGRACALR
jgi:exodeoxyribonuclease-1